MTWWRTTSVGTTVLATTTIVMPYMVSAQLGETMRWTVDGETRKAIVYAPTKPSADGVPLVFSFHGYGDFVQNFQHTDLHESWPEAVVVYFQALPSRRGDPLPRWQVEKGQDNDRDLKAIDIAVKALSEQFNVDPAQTYATGFSNGGSFTYLLWAERPAIFAAFAPVGAKRSPSVRPTSPGRPLFHVAGSRDTAVVLSDQQDAIRIATEVNGVAGKGAPCGEGCTIYGGGGTSPVMAWIHPGDHEYPDTTADRIVRFFREHRRKP